MVPITHQLQCKVREVRLQDLGPISCLALKHGSEVPFHVHSSLQGSFWRKFDVKIVEVHELLHK